MKAQTTTHKRGDTFGRLVPYLVIWLDDPDAEPVQFPTAASDPDKIIAVIGPSGIDALAAIGLFAQVE